MSAGAVQLLEALGGGRRAVVVQLARQAPQVQGGGWTLSGATAVDATARIKATDAYLARLDAAFRRAFWVDRSIRASAFESWSQLVADWSVFAAYYGREGVTEWSAGPVTRRADETWNAARAWQLRLDRDTHAGSGFSVPREVNPERSSALAPVENLAKGVALLAFAGLGVFLWQNAREAAVTPADEPSEPSEQTSAEEGSENAA